MAHAHIERLNRRLALSAAREEFLLKAAAYEAAPSQANETAMRKAYSALQRIEHSDLGLAVEKALTNPQHSTKGDARSMLAEVLAKRLGNRAEAVRKLRSAGEDARQSPLNYGAPTPVHKTINLADGSRPKGR
jgi:hypothetical protein